MIFKFKDVSKIVKVCIFCLFQKRVEVYDDSMNYFNFCIFLFILCIFLFSDFYLFFFCIVQIDCEWSKKLEWWDEKMWSEG